MFGKNSKTTKKSKAVKSSAKNVEASNEATNSCKGCSSKAKSSAKNCK